MKPTTKTLITGIALASFSLTTLARAQETKSDAHQDVAAETLLFVQNARGMAYDNAKGTLTLKAISPAVIFFTDRPYRIAGHVLLPGFLKAWDEGSDSFKKDPPNADISILDEGIIRSVVVEISNPRTTKNRLTYDVKVLEGELPASGGTCSLFIDGMFRGAGRGAAGGAIIGAACGDAGKGAAIGAAVGGVAGAARTRRAVAYGAVRRSEAAPVVATPAPAPVPATTVISVPNSNGSYTPVTLKQVTGGWQGPKGEIYPNLPTVDELRKAYGM